MGKLLLAMVCMALVPCVFAFDESEVSVWDNVYLNQDAIVPISIENNSLSDKELEVEFIGPNSVYFELSDLPEEIKAMESSEITLYLAPSLEMEGTTYNSTLIVMLGNETVLKEIKLHVSKIMPGPIETITPHETPTPKQGEFLPFVFLGDFESIMTFILAAIVIVLAIVFVAKLWSIKKEKRGEFFE